jgi:hypothetical protein
MARKYINPNRPALVTDEALDEAQQRAQAAAGRPAAYGRAGRPIGAGVGWGV